ncbi:MAG: hypothetical protein RL307_1356 [Pseudomonadota bacterium]|jgi:carbon-monoxide dehydrogenase small subunit
MNDITRRVRVQVNEEQVDREVPVRLHLIDFLREELDLTGSHLGCEHGVCGACQVELDGEVVRGCLTLAVATDGKVVKTIEGLSESGELKALQDAFMTHNAFQCGFCSAGMLLTARHIVNHHPEATRDEIRDLISGNYCRCTGYQAIVDAIESVLSQRKQAASQGAVA